MILNKIQKLIKYLSCVFLFLLPWQTAWIWQEHLINGKKWEYGSLVLYGTEILFWLILILQTMVWARNKKFPISNFQFLNKYKFSIVLLIWLLVFWSGLTILWSGNKGLSFYYWFRLLEGVALFFVMLNLKFNFRKIAWIVALSGVFQSIFSYWQFFTQKVVACKWLGIAEHLSSVDGTFVVQCQNFRWLRAYGSFAHPNVLGGFLVFSFFLCLYLYFYYRPSWPKVFSSISILIISGGIFFSFSRSAWLACLSIYILLFVFIFLQNKKRSELLKITGYLVLFAIILFFIYQPLVLTRIFGEESLEIKSNQERVEYLVESNEIISDNWFGGIGIGNYTHYLYQKDQSLHAFEYQPVHNIYLLIFSELGIIGLLFFVVLVFYIFLFMLKDKNNLVFNLCLLLIILIIGFFDHYFWTSYVGIIMLWLILLIIIKEK